MDNKAFSHNLEIKRNNNIFFLDLSGNEPNQEGQIEISSTELTRRWEKDGYELYLVPRQRYPKPVWSQLRGYVAKSFRPTSVRLDLDGFTSKGIMIMLAYKDLGMTAEHFSPVWRSIEGDWPERWPRLRSPLTTFNYSLVGQQRSDRYVSITRQIVQERLHYVEIQCKVSFESPNFVLARKRYVDLVALINEEANFMNTFEKATRRCISDEYNHLGAIKRLNKANWKIYVAGQKRQNKRYWEDHQEIPEDYFGGMAPIAKDQILI